MNIQLSDHFTYSRLLRFTFPSIIMMIFTSIYSVVDGIFVSNFVGKTSFAAVNLVMPVIMLLSAGGFMIGSGGSALIAMYLGEGKKKKANEIFSLLVYISIISSILLSIFAIIFMHKIVKLLGAEGELFENSVLYARIVISGGVAFVLQNIFQSFLIVAEKPNMGLKLTIAAGCTNMALDALFIAVFHLGIAGAALATVSSLVVGGIIPLVYFILPNKTPLKLGKTKFDISSLLKTLSNGSSEFVSSIAMSFASMLYNFLLINIAGENGIAAYGALMYVSFIFAAVYLGYGMGRAPIVSYHYGAGNTEELKNLFRKDCIIILLTNISLFILSELLAYPLAKIFSSYDKELFEMIRKAFVLFSPAYLFLGANTSASSFFTALNNGFVSALISFMRTLVFQTATVLILPQILGLNGIWISECSAEICTLILVTICLFKYRKKYSYF